MIKLAASTLPGWWIGPRGAAWKIINPVSTMRIWFLSHSRYWIASTWSSLDSKQKSSFTRCCIGAVCSNTSLSLPKSSNPLVLDSLLEYGWRIVTLMLLGALDNWIGAPSVSAVWSGCEVSNGTSWRTMAVDEYSLHYIIHKDYAILPFYIS